MDEKMDISIRNATPFDYIPICELFEEVDAMHRDQFAHLFQKPAGSVREHSDYMSWISDENVGLIVAVSDRQLVGLVHAMVRETPALPIFVPRRYATVDTIVVKSRLQNQGIGRMLMRKVEEWAISKGATSIELTVYEFNTAALNFYEKLGYQILSHKMNKELRN
jgi:diamine N-acetyltransferase